MASTRTGLTVALIYTRVSSEEQEREGVSLATQLAECRRYAAYHEWRIGSEYQDVLSGTRDDRPRYQDLLAEVRQLRAEGRPVVVVVLRLDRLGRRLLERVRCREEFKSLGVAVHSVREGEVNDMVAGFLAVMAEEEIRVLGERVVDSRRRIASQGWSVPGRKPWGYRWRDATGDERTAGAPRRVLEEDPETAPFVRELFTRAAQGQAVRPLVRWLAALPGPARGGKTLGYTAVRKALGAPVYVARQGSRAGKDRLRIIDEPRQKWPALVDDATWVAIHQRFASHAQVPLQATGHYLLTGFIRCHQCGSRMTGGRLKVQRPRYRCLREVPYCSGGVTGAPVEQAVLKELASLLDLLVSLDVGLRAALRRHWKRLARPDESAGMRQRAQQLEQAAARSRQRIGRATEMFVDGALTRANYDAVCAKSEADVDAAEAELTRLQAIEPSAALPPLDDVLRDVGGWASALKDADIPDRREVLKALVSRVIPRRVGYGTYEVSIEWTPIGDTLRHLEQTISSAQVA